MRDNGYARPGLAGKMCTVAATALLTAFAGTASATTGGAPTPIGAPPPPGSPAGAPSSAPSAGTLTLVSAETTPRKSFYFGYRFPRLSYTIGSSQPQNDLRIDVVNAAGEVVKTFYREDVAPGVPNEHPLGRHHRRRPAGPQRPLQLPDQPADRGRPAPARPPRRPHSASASPSTATPSRSSARTNSASAAAASAPPAPATPTRARTRWPPAVPRWSPPAAASSSTRAYEGDAGNYIVIDGNGTAYDFMYAHLAEPSPLHTGDSVRTGQPIGIVGDTGDATACHLHFEIWGAARLVRGRQPLRPASLPRKVGQLQLRRHRLGLALSSVG